MQARNARGMSSHRILVIEDEVAIRAALRRYFLRMGWTVDEAATGDDGYAMIRLDARQHDLPHYAIVYSDLRLPGLNGIEMYQRLRLTNPDVLPRVILSTGDVTTEDVVEFMRTADCVILQKPFELATLRSMIDLMLQRAPA